MAEAAVRLEGVTRTEGLSRAPIVRDVSLEIAPGGLSALVGADGAGKTTLMRILAGILKPQKGRVLIFGEDLYRSVGRVQRYCGYMPQKFGLYEDLSVMENFTLYADLFNLKGKARSARIDRLLAITDLARFTGRLAGRLSGGMKQKLGLACALLNEPRVLLLDEPSVGVDPLSRRELWKILRESASGSEMTVIVATTYMDEAEKCDSVFVLEEGSLRASSTPSALTALAAGRTLGACAAGRITREVQAELLDDGENVLDAVPLAGGVHVLLKPGRTVEDARRSHPGVAFTEEPARLEDGYLAGHFRGTGTGMHDWSWADPAGAAPPDPVIEARELVKKFGQFTAVDRTTFEVHPGEIFGLLGPNGAGKTTTFKMLCGLLAVSSGELSVAGIDVRSARELAKSNLGYMQQKFSLYAELSVRQNFNFFAGAYGLKKNEARERIGQLAGAFGLENVMDRPAKLLPGGVKQRLAMAVALLHRPSILFLDEPTSGADVGARRQFWRWMTELARRGTTIIVTTHFMEEAQYCDRLMIQDGGRCLVLGTPEEVRGGAATMDEAFIRVVEEARTAGRAA